MSRVLCVVVVAVAVLVGGEAKAQYGAGPSVGVSTGNFEVALQPYGAWLEHPSYGRIWQPSAAVVGSGFYPYGTGGQWQWTDAGWSFESSYPFGWATFHYGRWVYEPGYGWVWLPGYEWAPAWVSWRTGGPYVGWAPLGPHGAPASAPNHWCFVERNSFTMANVYGRAVGEGRFHQAMAVTQPWARQGPARDFVNSSSYGGAPRSYREERRLPVSVPPQVFAPRPSRERVEVGGRGFESGRGGFEVGGRGGFESGRGDLEVGGRGGFEVGGRGSGVGGRGGFEVGGRGSGVGGRGGFEGSGRGSEVGGRAGLEGARGGVERRGGVEVGRSPSAPVFQSHRR